MVGGLWRIDANFKSSIYLRNIVETDPVTATPILYLSNGNKYTLPDVTVEPAGVVIISINDALQKKGMSSWATLSGYLEIQYTWPWDPFCATVRNVDTAHSLIFTYSLRPTLPLPLRLLHPPVIIPTHTVEGMWWKQESNVSAFVALANLSSQPAQASLQVTDDHGNPLSEHNVTVSPHGMKTVTLSELATLKKPRAAFVSFRVRRLITWLLTEVWKTKPWAILPQCLSPLGRGSNLSLRRSTSPNWV